MKAGWRAVVVAAMGLGVFAPSALAVPTLTGEALSGTATGFRCNSIDENTVTVDPVATGAATGPYAGTFTEQAHLKLVFGQGQPDSDFNAAFTIRSGSTTITGTKTGGIWPFGSCGAGIPATTGWGTQEGGDAQYSARLTTTTGRAGSTHGGGRVRRGRGCGYSPG